MIFVAGVVGIVVNCAVIIHNRKKRKENTHFLLNYYLHFNFNGKIVFVIASTHTATNCYLFSLAVADLTALLFGKESIQFNSMHLNINAINCFKVCRMIWLSTGTFICRWLWSLRSIRDYVTFTCASSSSSSSNQFEESTHTAQSSSSSRVNLFFLWSFRPLISRRGLFDRLFLFLSFFPSFLFLNKPTSFSSSAIEIGLDPSKQANSNTRSLGYFRFIPLVNDATATANHCVVTCNYFQSLPN